MVAAIFVSAFIGVVFIAILAMAAELGIVGPLTSRMPKKTKKLKAKIAELERENSILVSENKELKIELTAHRLQLPWVDVPKEEQ